MAGIQSIGPTSLRGVVFDMDGVIVDSHPAHRSAWKHFLQSLGRSVSDEEMDFILDGRKREEILQYFLGELTRDQISEFGNRKDDMLRSLGNAVQPIEGVTDFLALLGDAGIPAAVATSAGRTRTDGTLRELGVIQYFAAIITGDDVAAGKPDPSIYRIAAQRLDEDPLTLLAIEDAVSGVRAAKSAGLWCAGIGSGLRAQQLRAAGAEPVAADFRSMHIMDLVARLA